MHLGQIQYVLAMVCVDAREFVLSDHLQLVYNT